MTIYEKIETDRKDFKSGDRVALSLLLSEICIDGKPMSDKDAIIRLTQMQKVCIKNIKIYDEAGKPDAANKEAVFNHLINCYLPEPAYHADIIEAIEELGLPMEMGSMGPLMKHLKSKFKIVDGNFVKQILIG